MPGLPLGRVHESESLFPIFAERMMDPHRAERAETLRALGLDSGTEPLEFSRSLEVGAPVTPTNSLLCHSRAA
jgi:hypothetical protein